MKKFSDSVSSISGDYVVVLASATVTVYLTGTQTLATIYSTNAGAAKTNPFTSSATGLVEFYAADGRYDLKVEKTGYSTVTITDVLMEDPVDGVDDNISGVAITNSTVDNTPVGATTPAAGTFTGVNLSTTSPAAAGVGRFRWNDTDGTVDLGLQGGLVDLQLGQKQVAHVYNNTGFAFTITQVVRVTGSQAFRMTAALAQANTEASSSKTFGVIGEPISNNSYGYAVTSGLIKNVDTSAYTEGAALWLSPSVAGGMTTTKPQAPDHQVLVGWCVRSHPTLGQIYVKVQNGNELDELHDVKITSVANNDVLQYDSGQGVWKNAPVSIDSALVVSKTSATGSAILPSGTSAQRDGSPQFGYTRANSTTGLVEWWNSTAWTTLGGASAGGVIYENTRVINENFTGTASRSGHTVGPLTVATGKTLTVPTGEALLVFGPSTAGAGNTDNLTTGAQLIRGLKTFDTQPRVSGVVSMVQLSGSTAFGSSGTYIPRFTTTLVNQGTDISYNTSTEATNGAVMTINTPGVYAITYVDQFNTTVWMGITLNTVQPAVAIQSLTNLTREALNIVITAAANFSASSSWTGFLPAGSVIRPHAGGVTKGASTTFASFTIVRVA